MNDDVRKAIAELSHDELLYVVSQVDWVIRNAAMMLNDELVDDMDDSYGDEGKILASHMRTLKDVGVFTLLADVAWGNGLDQLHDDDQRDEVIAEMKGNVANAT